jgi:hypothetical protein
MRPRAACRLETLGFEHVYDYVPAKPSGSRITSRSSDTTNAPPPGNS